MVKIARIQSGSECELLSCRAKFWGRFGFLGGIQAHEISVQNWFSSKQPFKNSELTQFRFTFWRLYFQKGACFGELRALDLGEGGGGGWGFHSEF